MVFLLKVWGWIKAAGRWLLDNPLAIAGMVGAVIGAWFMWKRSSNKIASLEDAVAVKATMVKVAKAEGRASALDDQADEVAEEREELKRSIAESKRRVAEIHEGKRLEGMSDDDVAELFTQAGL